MMKHRRIAILALSILILAVVCLAPRLWRDLRPIPAAPIGPFGERTAHFPKDYSIGELHARDWGSTHPLWWIRGRYLGKARGDVVIPADKELQLQLSPIARKTIWHQVLGKWLGNPKPRWDFSPLASLGPADLQSLKLEYKGDRRTLGRADLGDLRRLTGLHELLILGPSGWNLSSLGSSKIGRPILKVNKAGLDCIAELPLLRTLDLQHVDVSDKGLAHLKNLAALESLNLWNSRINDVHLAHVGRLTSLRELNLGRTQITDAGLAHLRNLTSLRSLTLEQAGVARFSGAVRSFGPDPWMENSKVTDAGLAHLTSLTLLEHLNISDTRITDGGLVHLGEMRSLKNLDLGNTFITDAGLVHLKGLTSLQFLQLHGTRITDAGLTHLSDLTSLKALFLLVTEITDEGLVHFKGMTSLGVLDLRETKVTKTGVGELEKALPKCKILN
jgi:hypothetical protein